MTENDLLQMIVGTLLTLLVAILTQVVAHGLAIARDKRRERLEDHNEELHDAP